LIECEIDEQGKARSIRVAQSAGCEELDRAALEAVRKVKWQPAYKDGLPVASKIIQPVAFVLRAR
jgi:protein TonB